MFDKKYRENERLIEKEEVECSRSSQRQLLACFLASLMSLSSGTVTAGWTSSNPPSEDDDLMLWSTEQESWIVSIYVFGALLGALPAGLLSQNYGRKKFLLWLALPMTIGWILCQLRLKNLALECLGRFICGLSLGATTVAVPLYSSDVSSDVLRGRTGVFLDFMLCAGIQYAYVARAVLPGLRTFCLACAVVPLVFVSLFSYMPESPVYLFNEGRYEEAATVLRWLRGRRFDVKNEFERIERSQWENRESLECNTKANTKNKRFLVKVWIVSIGLVLSQRLSGAGGVIQYSAELFKLSGATINPSLACIIIGNFQLAASWVSFLLIDKIGRRTLLLTSSAVVTTCLVILTTYFILLKNGALDDSPWKLSILFVLCTFISAFRLGLGPIPWFMTTELVPASHNSGRMQSVIASFSWFLTFIIMKSFKILVEKDTVALWGSFTTYSIVGFLFILIYVPETNNKSREQIRFELCE